VVPDRETKESTGGVYAGFDDRRGADGFDQRVAATRAALAAVSSARDLAALPRNDLASSPLAAELEAAGAFRADVSGAGPTVYGLFEDLEPAAHAAERFAAAGVTHVVRPVEASQLA
jgi:4-diphosphocytidyl-2C-methyl-D-erythritol kinase